MASFQKMFGGRKRGSNVWKYFQYDAQKRKSTCIVPNKDQQLCSVSVATKNPTNLKNHLKCRHLSQYTDLIAQETEESEAKKKRFAQEVLEQEATNQHGESGN